MANHLAGETSPYLLQHAHNPVDWWPWSEEALAKARAEEKPILLSIGYAACHWCHVMERESFEDEATAAQMNESFVCIKVDREERPDLDGIYMQATQAMTGHGGWPMTVFLTPEGEPFYAGTYFPPEDRQGMPSFRRVLSAVSDAWQHRREQVVRTTTSMRELYAASSERTRVSGPLDEALLARALARTCVHRRLGELRQDVAAIGGDLRRFLVEDARHLGEDVGEARPAIACGRWKIRAAPNRRAVGSEEHGERPAALLAQRMERRHVDLVDVGAFLAVDLDVDEQAIHHRRGRLVLEALVRHDVAPVAGGVADGEQDRLVGGCGLGERRRSPGAPVHRVVLVLQQVGARLVAEKIFAHVPSR
jgi:hypothetical protein